MKNKLKFYAAVFIFFSLIIINHRVSYGGIAGDRDFVSISGPALLSPDTEDIDLKSQAFVEFRWERTDSFSTDHYELRLYKGRQAVTDTLLMKKQISTDDYPFKLEASTFEVNQVYTWSLTQVYTNGRKSDKSYTAFMIIRK